MPSIPAASAILAGPRGRRICWQLLGFPPLPPVVEGAALRRAASAAASGLRDGGEDVAAALFKAFRRSVDAAMYWQPPDDIDRMLCDAEPAAALSPVAGALTELAPAWWAAPVTPHEQRYLQTSFDDSEPSKPISPGVAQRLRAGRAEEERRNIRFGEIRTGQLGRDRATRHGAVRPGLDPGQQGHLFDNVSGCWWSTPNRVDVVTTTREIAETGPVGLWLVEDFPGWRRASSMPVVLSRPARICEIDGPGAWADLVRRHPFDVTDARTPDWKRATGRTGRWLVPDWVSVAGEFDGVHVSAFGYLTTAGWPVPVGGEHGDVATVLAGWAPDETFWLTDIVRLGGTDSGDTATRWICGDDAEWRRDAAGRDVTRREDAGLHPGHRDRTPRRQS